MPVITSLEYNPLLVSKTVGMLMTKPLKYHSLPICKALAMPMATPLEHNFLVVTSPRYSADYTFGIPPPASLQSRRL